MLTGSRLHIERKIWLTQSRYIISNIGTCSGGMVWTDVTVVLCGTVVLQLVRTRIGMGRFLELFGTYLWLSTKYLWIFKQHRPSLWPFADLNIYESPYNVNWEYIAILCDVWCINALRGPQAIIILELNKNLIAMKLTRLSPRLSYRLTQAFDNNERTICEF